MHIEFLSIFSDQIDQIFIGCGEIAIPTFIYVSFLLSSTEIGSLLVQLIYHLERVKSMKEKESGYTVARDSIAITLITELRKKAVKDGSVSRSKKET